MYSTINYISMVMRVLGFVLNHWLLDERIRNKLNNR